MTTHYEWAVEVLVEAPSEANEFDPDIDEVHHWDSYAEALAKGTAYHEGEPWRVVLIRDVGNDVDGLTDRAWAYPKDGKLPETFTYGAGEDSGIRVPLRFHHEYERGGANAGPGGA